MRYFIYIFLITLSFSGCIEPYEFDQAGYEKYLVVDGLLTDEFKFHEVRLSETQAITSTTTLTISSATVYVQDNSGTKYAYSEKEPGLYVSNIEYQAEPGAQYSLYVTTAEGKSYNSRPVELIPSPDIGAIYPSYEEIISEELNKKVKGIQFFVDATDETGKAKYYRYEWEETYEIRVPYPTPFEYVEDFDWCSTSYDEWPRWDENISRCFPTSSSTDLLIANVLTNKNQAIEAFPVRFVSLETDVLRNTYSLQVKQFAINSQAYEFYRKLKEVNQSGGSLFDKQQGAVIGNMISTTDPTEAVLGYFEVSGVSIQRKFFKEKDYPEPFVKPDFRYGCYEGDQILQIPVGQIDSIYQRRPTLNIITIDCMFGTALVGSSSCTQCASYAPNVKPDFWID